MLSLFRILTYPLVMAMTILAYFAILNSTGNIFFASYAPPTLAAITIILLERVIPYRAEWAPNRSDLLNDLTFMLCVQILLPMFLSFFIAHWLLQHIPEQQKFLASMWPQNLGIFWQALLMLLIVDFFRYWLHRANHNFKPLWRLHAVHHSPLKLYWVNTGRFHPIEKGFQFLVDSFPFILAGVSREVLALYFLIYSTNGFFQHCNIDLKLGWLNYIMSGPELHRWHHSKLIKESNNNYGSTLIVWDLLFRSYFNPRDRTVDQLGLLVHDYPLDFLAQLQTPFKADALTLKEKQEDQI